MNQEKIGKFIQELRKSKNLTQDELGSMLGISGKSVSKWECGLQMPDLGNVGLLSEILGVTVDELLAGERLTPAVTEVENIKKKNRIFINSLKHYNNKYKKKMLRTLRIVILVFIFLIAALFTANNFNKNRVYTVFCKNGSYRIHGYLIFNQKQNIFILNEIVNHSDLGIVDEKLIDTILIELLYNDTIIHNSEFLLSKPTSLGDALKNLHIVLDDNKKANVNLINYHTDLNKIKLKIEYSNTNNKVKGKPNDFIVIPLKFVETFTNNKLFY